MLFWLAGGPDTRTLADSEDGRIDKCGLGRRAYLLRNNRGRGGMLDYGSWLRRRHDRDFGEVENVG